jgi:hypothetical protein
MQIPKAAMPQVMKAIQQAAPAAAKHEAAPAAHAAPKLAPHLGNKLHLNG